MKIILATHNKNKISEFKEIIKDYDIEVISLFDLNYNDEIEENGTTLKENAFIKAKTIYDMFSLPVLSDDTGLLIDALDGAPGVYSARYSGQGSEGNRKLVLKNLEGVSNRSAHFETVLCFYQNEDNVNYFIGDVYGSIDYKETGSSGFGYDSIFLYNGISFASMGLIEKSKVSHRHNAFMKFKEYLDTKKTS